MMMMQRVEENLPSRLERRRFQRWELDQPARVSAQEQGVSARCLDVSVGGALLRLQTEVPVPSQVLLYITLSSMPEAPVAILSRVVEVTGRKVRVAFDPLPAFVASAIAAEIRGRRRPVSQAGTLLN
jgi:hypothetical protein